MKNQKRNNWRILFWVSFLHILLYFFLYSPDYNINYEDSLKGRRELLNTVKLVETGLRSEGLLFENANVSLSNMPDYPTEVAGVTRTRGVKWIKLRRNYFINATSEVREALLLHEYGHYLGLDHDDDMFYDVVKNFECPKTVMHSTNDLYYCFNLYRDSYYRDIANRVKAIDNAQISVYNRSVVDVLRLIFNTKEKIL